MRTILEIEILMHYYSRGGDFPNLDAPAVKSAINEFVEKGLLKKRGGEQATDSNYASNDTALKPYIDALRSVPLPTQKWTI